ncbi:glycosyltransferase family A protein [Rhodothermus marinus]|uniref:glycosyltransferase family A protein n=1 Tax=Rhodothermus marinus TaxID=29549 RepID=UPI001FB42FFE|nr:glycosyltransferase family A protein [Rhodothermus marinus]
MAQELQEKQRWPKVSCLMVTADRPHLVRRAIRSYLQQTYPNRELVVLDNGRQPLDEALLAEVPADELVYARVEPRPDLVIGTLRNQALELARGDYIAPQWDDDDWSHPERLMRQMQVLLSGDYDACTLAGTLMHVNHPAYFFSPVHRAAPPWRSAHHRAPAQRDDSLPRPAAHQRHALRRGLASHRPLRDFAAVRILPVSALFPRRQPVGAGTLSAPHAQHAPGFSGLSLVPVRSRKRV